MFNLLRLIARFAKTVHSTDLFVVVGRELERDPRNVAEEFLGSDCEIYSNSHAAKHAAKGIPGAKVKIMKLVALFEEIRN